MDPRPPNPGGVDGAAPTVPCTEIRTGTCAGADDAQRATSSGLADMCKGIGFDVGSDLEVLILSALWFIAQPTASSNTFGSSSSSEHELY